MLERKETVNRDYIVPPKMKCKGSEPALLPITLDPEARERNKQARNKPPGGKAKQEIEELKEQLQKDKNSQPSVTPAEEEGMDEPHGSVEPEPDLSQGPIAPKYTMVYSYDITIGNFVNTSNIYEPKNQETPTQIRFRFEVPLAASAEHLKCDVHSTRIQLEYESKYFLALDLLYEINENAAKAKFISSKKVLELIVPVVRKIRGHQLVVTPTQKLVEEVFSTSVAEPKEAEQVALKTQATDSSTPHEDQSVPKAVQRLEPIAEEQKSNPWIQELASDETSPESKDQKSNEGIAAEERVKDSELDPASRIEGYAWLTPQITYLEQLWIFLFHLPGYRALDIEIVDTQNCLMLRYKNTSYWVLSFQQKYNFTIEKSIHKDYLGIHLHFASPEDAGMAKLDQISPSCSLEEAQLQFEELMQLKLANEVSSRPIIEEVSEMLPTEGETQVDTENQINTEASDPNLSQVEAEKLGDQPEVREGQESQTTSEGTNPSESEQLRVLAAQDPNNFGPQLLDLKLLDFIIQLD